MNDSICASICAGTFLKTKTKSNGKPRRKRNVVGLFIKIFRCYNVNTYE